MAAHRLGELAALFVAHVSRRGADEPGDRKLFHILAHVDAHQIFLTVKQRLGQRLGQFGLTNPGGTQEQEGADGLFRVGDACPGAENGLAHQPHRLILAHNPLMQDILQVEQLLPLTLHQLGHRDTRPPLHNTGDLLLSHLVPEQVVLLGLGGKALLLLQLLFELRDGPILKLGGLFQVILPLGFLQLGVGFLQLLPQLLNPADGVLFILPLGLARVKLVPQPGQFPLNVCQTGPGELVVLLFQGCLLDFTLDNFAGDHVQFGGHGVHLGADQRARLVDEVNGLVGEEAVCDIAVAEGGGGHNGPVGDFYAVKYLITLFEAPEYGHRVLHRGLGHHDRLKTALQRGVLLDILAVLVEGGGADAVELTPGKHWLEQIARIHGPLGLARAHDGVQLVDEQQDAALGLLDLVEHGLQPLLKLSPVLGPGDERPHVQGEDGLVLQTCGYVPLDDALGQPLGDGGFAHAGFADEDGVILTLAGQNTDHVSDFIIPADHRVQLVLPGPLHQVGAVLFQRLIGFLRVVAGHALVSPQGGQGLHDRLLVHMVGPKQLL